MQIENNSFILQIRQYLSDTLQMELLKTGHISSEALFNSIDTIVERTLSGITITAKGLFYGKYVNAGRRKGKKGVPVNKILEWIRRTKMNIYGKREESVAFAIQTSIKQRGLKAAPFIDRSINKFNKSKRMEAHIEKFVVQYLDELLMKLFQELSE